MSRHFAAEKITPFDMVKQIEGRLALQLPMDAIKEQNLYENYVQDQARFTLVWWIEGEGEYQPQKALTDVVAQLSKERPYLNVVLSPVKKNIDTAQMMVTVTAGSDSKEASPVVKPLPVPIVFTVGGNEYHIVSLDSGVTFTVLREDVILAEDIQSVAAALGKILKFVLVDLDFVEELSTGKQDADSIDKEFLIGLAEWFANSPVVTKEALKHLTTFVELVTKKEFRPEK